jgi:NADPH-dependent glutamate synthase beta subunit-like oxidoreductase
MEAPTAIVGGLGDRVAMLRTERRRATRNGGVEGAGEYTDWDVQAVSRAVGYRSTALPGLPFDDRSAVIPNDGGRVLDLDGDAIPGTYVTGWIKRGLAGSIGHTKSDASETVGHLLAETVPTATARAQRRSTPVSRSAKSRSRGSLHGSASTGTRSPSGRPRVEPGSSSPAVRRCCASDAEIVASPTSVFQTLWKVPGRRWRPGTV